MNDFFDSLKEIKSELEKSNPNKKIAKNSDKCEAKTNPPENLLKNSPTDENICENICDESCDDLWVAENFEQKEGRLKGEFFEFIKSADVRRA